MCVSMLDSHGRLYILYDCAFPCWTPTELVYPSVFMLDPPQGLYILLCECVFPCWTPTVACISCMIVRFHAGLPQSLYILVCLCWTSHRACISSCVNVCFHAGLPRSLVYPV